MKTTREILEDWIDTDDCLNASVQGPAFKAMAFAEYYHAVMLEAQAEAEPAPAQPSPQLRRLREDAQMASPSVRASIEQSARRDFAEELDEATDKLKRKVAALTGELGKADTRIKELERNNANLRRAIPDPCKECHGSKGRWDEEAQDQWHDCPSCGGTGLEAVADANRELAELKRYQRVAEKWLETSGKIAALLTGEPCEVATPDHVFELVERRLATAGKCEALTDEEVDAVYNAWLRCTHPSQGFESERKKLIREAAAAQRKKCGHGG